MNKFFFKLTKFKDIFNSKEMKIFLSGTNDVKKALENLKKPSYDELVLKYKETFLDYYDVLNLLILRHLNWNQQKLKFLNL